MNYYQHHIGDFIRDTSRLSDAQCMAYLRLIWMYYETEQSLDCDIDALAFKVGANASDVQQIVKHFFFEHEGRLHHSRCDKEILAFKGKSDKAKKSANARWENAKAMRTHSERSADEPLSDANHKPVTNNQSSLREEGPRARSPRSQAVRCPVDVSPEVWSSFLMVRKTKRAAVTDLAILGIRKEATQAGISLEEALTICCVRGWAGFNSTWDWQTDRPQAKPQAESFRERDARLAREAFDEMAGRTPSQGSIIDITPTTLEITHASDQGH